MEDQEKIIRLAKIDVLEMLEVLKTCDKYLDKIPDDFMKQLEKAVSDLVNRHVFYVERYIYYVDLMEGGKEPDFDTVEKDIYARNEAWIKEFKIKPIKDKDKL